MFNFEHSTVNSETIVEDLRNLVDADHTKNTFAFRPDTIEKGYADEIERICKEEEERLINKNDYSFKNLVEDVIKRCYKCYPKVAYDIIEISDESLVVGVVSEY